MKKPVAFAIALAASIWLGQFEAPAVILFRTGDPDANTTAPAGVLAGSGWQYEGLFGAFLGTAIAPHYFLTADHIGQQSNTFTYQGIDYTITWSQKDPESDLHIYRVAETLLSFAPLYNSQDEAGKQLVVFGCGTQRGNAITTNGISNGWAWGGGDQRKRWGENTVEMAGYITLSATFDQSGLPNEAQLSSGDSGGGLFIRHNGEWQLAGVNLSINGTSFTEQGEIHAALFDRRGTYTDATHAHVVTGPSPQASFFLATRVSQRLAWLHSVIGEVPAAPTGLHLQP